MAETIRGRYTFSNTANLANQHVSFKSGTQEELNKFLLSSNDLTKKGKASEGTFYLTTDTHRLYIGRKISASGNTSYIAGEEPIIPIPINEGIQYVDDLTALEALANSANAGEFYYVGENNILAIYNGSQWVQINPNTNDTISVTSVNITYNSTSSSSATLVYDLILNQVKTDVIGSITSLPSITASFSINRAAITGDVAVGISATTSSGISVVQLTGNNTASDYQIPIVSTSGITTTVTNVEINGVTVPGIQLQGTTYSMTSEGVSTSAVKIILQKSSGSTDEVQIQTGSNLSVTRPSATSTVTIEHKNSGVTTGTYGVTANTSLSQGNSFIVPKITVDAKGHITSATDVSVTLPSFQGITATNDGHLSLVDQSGNNISSTSPIVYYKITVDGNSTTSTINNQGYLGSFYSKDGVDNLIEEKFRTFNAMTYKGTVGNSQSTVGGNSLASVTQVSVGDTYMVNEDSSIIVQSGSTTANLSCHVGDLLIAQGTEATDSNYIVSDFSWSVIPAGQVDTTYTFNTQSLATNNQATLRLHASNGGNQDINIYGTTYITTRVISGESDALNGICIEHNTSGTTTGTFGGPSGNSTAISLGWDSSSNTFAIPKITVDAYGHITSAVGVTYTLPVLNTYSIESSTEDAARIILKDNGSGGQVGSVTFIAGEKMSVTSSAAGITYSHATITSTSKSASEKTLNYSAATTVITNIAIDDYGHITSYTKTPLKVYEYSLGLTNNNLALIRSDGNALQTFSFTSSTLSISANTITTNAYSYNFELIWGSF